jgi:hypothetical protein
MRKYLFLAIALVAGVLAFTSCEKNDPNAIKGIKFCCDLDRGLTPVREYLYFGEKDDFEWGMEVYEDQERTKMTSAFGDYGTYVLNEEQQHIDMTFTGSFNVSEGQRTNHDGQASHKNGRWNYKFSGDTIYITAENGTTSKYWRLK